MNLTRRSFLGHTTAAVGLGVASLPGWSINPAVAAPGLESGSKNNLADIALKAAKKLGASYADLRINRYRYESISTREQRVLSVSRDQNSGFGTRVLYRGAWGFASHSQITADNVRAAVRQAWEMARENATRQKRKIELVPVPEVNARWKSAHQEDPFDLPIAPKIELLLAINQAALAQSGVGFVSSSMSWVNEQKFFASTDGSRIEQYLIRGNPSFTVTAVDRAKGDFQTRNSLGGPQSLGYEYMKKHDWVAEAKQAASEAVEKLKAKPVTPGKYDLILHPSHLWLTIHESVGHSTELDRAMWWEANYAGTSFLTRDKVGKLKFGADHINFFADRIQPTGLATVGYDDEGVRGQKWYLVRNGIFVDWQTTRDLAAQIGRRKSYGCLYADSWGTVPFPRMPNVSLEPGRQALSLEDLARDVEKGIVIYGNGSFSIDQQRYNFQFGGQTFWEVENGKVQGMLRDVAYQSRTTDFWNACDGLGGQSTYQLGGSFVDGKGEPPQSNAVSHGCPVARIRQINVLNTDSSGGAGGTKCC